jgi:hypothetical protein
MRAHFLFIFAFAFWLPSSTQIAEVGETLLLKSKSIMTMTVAPPQQGAQWLDHPTTPDEGSGDFGGGHRTSLTFLVLAFIFTVLAIFVLYERRTAPPTAIAAAPGFPQGLPLGYTVVAIGMLILGTLSLFTAGGGSGDHPTTPDEGSGEAASSTSDGISLFGCYTHHVTEFWLCIIALGLSVIVAVMFFMRNVSNTTLWLLALAAILELIVAAMVLC